MENDGITHILDHFSIEKKLYRLTRIQQGYINDTYLVKDGDAPLYILQRINTNVFKNVDGLMGNIHKALIYLDAPNYSKIDLINTDSGESFYQESPDNCWRLMGYIADSTAYDNAPNSKIAHEAGRIIGRFHQLLQNAPLDDFVDTIPRFHDLELRKEQFEKALGEANSKRKTVAKKAIEFAIETFPKLEIAHKEKLPMRICHNDTKLNNILFSKDGDKALCLIDLDTLMKGYFHYDFGDAVRTIVNPAPEDEKEHYKVRFDKKLFDTFMDGLKINEDFLTEKELQTLPLGAVLMPFLHGLRALTDYLSGNIYYKVRYETQNLDRCLSLFNFTQKALDNVDFMEAVIKEKFGHPF